MRTALIPLATLVLGVATSRPLPADETPAPDKPQPAAAPTKAYFEANDTHRRDRHLRVITLRHARVETAVEMLKRLGYNGGYVADPRTNSIILNAPPDEMGKLSEVIKVMDRAPEAGAIPDPSSLNSPTSAPAGSMGVIGQSISQSKRSSQSPFERPARPGDGPIGEESAFRDDVRTESAVGTPKKIGDLRRAFESLDAQASRTAEKLRQLLAAGQEGDTAAELKQTLRTQVTAAYKARRQMQQAEVEWLRQRLSSIEHQLEDRERIQVEIIARRIHELLHPGTQWDPALTANDQAAGAETLPASDLVQLAKEQANRQNLKQLALAMHNFHDTYNHFPKAVSTARDLGHESEWPHSWRIDLLPFLGAADLYNEYKMDEPWDGPNNKKLLDRMPAIFRSPYDDSKSTNTAYAVLVGKGTVFEPSAKGIKISDITDGTSNTLLVVEAKRNIPWMKPEDIPFDPEIPAPQLGGFVPGKFAAVMADGRTCVFERSKVADILPWMIRRNDGHPLKIPFE